MTDSLNENVSNNNDQPAVESDSAKEQDFMNTKTPQEQGKRRFKNTYVPSWVKEKEESESPSGGEPLPWLSLSHLVDGTTAADDQIGEDDLASRYPKAQGGRVVMRGPVDGETLPEQEEGSNVSSIPYHASAYHSIADDLEEPRLGPDDVNYDERYLPDDVYTDENPFDVISVQEPSEAEAPKKREGWFKRKFGHGLKPVWKDVDFEVIGDGPNDVAGEQAEIAPNDQPTYDDELIEDEGLLEDELLDDELSENEPIEQPEVHTEYEDAAIVEPLATPHELSVPELNDSLESSAVPAVDVEFTDEQKSKDDELTLPDDSNMSRWALFVWRVKNNYHHARTITIAVCVIIVLLIVYVIGIFTVSGKFLPNSSIGDCDVSGMTLEEATEALTKQTENYTLTISAGDFASLVDGGSVSIDRDEPTVAQKAFSKQFPYIWPYALLFHYDPNIDQGITYDNIKFDQQVNDAVDEYNRSVLPADKVKITLDSTTQMYKLEGSVEGKAVDKDVVLESAHNAIGSMRVSAKPNKNKAFRDAKVSDLPQYQKTIDNANAVRNASIPVLVDGSQVAICQPDVLRQWVTVSDQPAVVVNTAAIQTWADSSLSPLVHKDGEWGEMFLDTNVFVDTFAKHLINGETAPVEAVTYAELNREGESRMQAYENSPWNKKLGRYIDVDLSAQFARLFDKNGNVLWESAFVSGDMYGGHQTVTGTYEIYAHLPGQVLVGLDYNGDGQPDYESYVNFWMPFYGGYGLHDATWRDDFGGDLYLYNGSHGCINLPYDKTEELYGMVNVGEKVYVHEE